MAGNIGNNDFNDRLEEQQSQAKTWMDKDTEINLDDEIFNQTVPMSKEELKSRKKREKRKNKKPFKISLMKKMMLYSLGPLLFMGLVVTLYTIITLRTTLKNTKEDSLTSFAKGVEGAIEKNCDGVLIVENNVLVMGEEKNQITPDYLDGFTDLGGIDLTLYYGDVSYATTFKDTSQNRLTGLRLAEDKVSDVISGNKKIVVDNDIVNGKKYYSAYVPLKDGNGKTVGAIVASQARSAVDNVVNRQIISLATIAGIILVVSTLIVGISSYSIANSTKKMEESLTAIADGYLSITVNLSALSRNDEIGTMARALQNTAKKMTDVIHDINSIIRRLIKASEKLGTSSEQSAVTAGEISSAVEEIAQGAIKQADDADKANDSVTEMGDGINSIVESLYSLKESTEIMLSADQQTDEIIAELVDSGKKTAGALEEVTRKVNDTDKSVSKIQEAVSLITNIAEETSLLSLNASIEAARAGEAGKGFSVVAIQIQKLADESSKSADRIRDAIEVLSKDSHASVQVMGEMSKAIITQQKQLELARKQFGKVSDGINTTINETKTIYGLSQTCADERVKVLDRIVNLSEISEKNVASTESTTGSMTNLNDSISLVSDSAKNLQKMASALENKIGFYKL